MKVVENNLVQSRLGDRMDELLTFETEETILHILEWIWTVEEDCAAAVT